MGTDLAHAIPLAMIAGLGHLTMGNVDYALLLSLLVGSIPGVLIGALISTRAPLALIRYAIAIVLGAVAVKMLML
ncbi:TSUP family transporter [Ideonella paludis]|uniref:TSUP family transporter n=1 Tax=Ideonella paludis TaxID=1233411 RepID=UPI003639E6F9